MQNAELKECRIEDVILKVWMVLIQFVLRW